MDWLTRLPVIGPVAERFFRSRPWRVYTHLDARKWARLAAAITFTSFLSLFPVLVLAAAVGAALLTPDQMHRLQDAMARQVPGISDQLNLQDLVDNAGTVGLVAGLLLAFTGAGWVGTLRESLRAVWDLEEDPGNPVLLKLRDLAALVGLGVVGLLSLGGSAFALTAADQAARGLGLADGGAGAVVLRGVAYALAVAVDFVLLWYVLTLLPGVRPPHGDTLVACAMGAVGFELLKLLLGGYLKGVAAKSMYGAFGVPVALLLWISFMTKLLLFCAAWTAEPRTRPDAAGPGPEAEDGGGTGRAAKTAGDGVDALGSV